MSSVNNNAERREEETQMDEQKQARREIQKKRARIIGQDHGRLKIKWYTQMVRTGALTCRIYAE